MIDGSSISGKPVKISPRFKSLIDPKDAGDNVNGSNVPTLPKSTVISCGITFGIERSNNVPGAGVTTGEEGRTVIFIVVPAAPAVAAVAARPHATTRDIRRGAPRTLPMHTRQHESRSARAHGRQRHRLQCTRPRSMPRRWQQL